MYFINIFSKFVAFAVYEVSKPLGQKVQCLFVDAMIRLVNQKDRYPGENHPDGKISKRITTPVNFLEAFWHRSNFENKYLLESVSKFVHNLGV